MEESHPLHPVTKGAMAARKQPFSSRRRCFSHRFSPKAAPRSFSPGCGGGGGGGGADGRVGGKQVSAS